MSEPRWFDGVCPVHGVRLTYLWQGETYMLSPCSAILPEESKVAGRIVRCGAKVEPREHQC